MRKQTCKRSWLRGIIMKRILSMIVVAMMLLNVTAVTPVAAEETAPEIQLGADALQRKAIVWFGSTEGTEAIISGWRVLKVEEDGSLLVLLNEIFTGDVFNAEYSDYNAWEGSVAQRWCKNMYDSWYFALEKKMILPTTITESGDYSNTLAVSIDGEYLYFLSKREIENEGYFDSVEDRIVYEAGNDHDSRWWTRSGSNGDRGFTAWVKDDGTISNYQVTNWAGYRPAFHLSLESVLFVSSAVGGKADSAALSPIGANEDNNWKLTILDGEREFEADDSELTAQQGDAIAIPYTKATTGDGEYISVLVVRKNRAAEEVVAYASIPAEAAEGTAEFTVPADMELGEYTLKVFNEHKSGDKLSDYASNFTEIALEVTHVHEWGEPEYKWSDDGTKVTATRVCTLDPEHVETETVTARKEITKQPTCEDPGETTYIAEFENEAFETKTRTAAEPAALGHDLKKVEAKEPQIGEEGNIEYYVCQRCGKYFEDEKAENEIVDHDSVIIPALEPDPVPDTGTNDNVRELAAVMMIVSLAASALYVSAEKRRREEER